MGTSVSGITLLDCRSVSLLIGAMHRTIVKAKRQVKESEELLLIMLTYQSSTAKEEERKKKERTEIHSKHTDDQGDAQTWQCSSLRIYMATKTSTLV